MTFIKPFSFSLLAIIGFSLVQSFSISLVSQDLERFRPKPEVVDPLNQEPQIVAPEETDEPLGSGESVGTIAGVRLVARPEQVIVDSPPSTSGVVIVDETLVVPESVEAAVAEFIGGPLSLRTINEITRNAVLAYRASGMPVVDIAFPEQDVSGGVLQMVVVIGRAGTINVEGNRWFDDEIYLRSFRTETGDILYEAPILSDLRYLNRNPYRSVNLAYTPGDEFGAADVILQATEQRPWTVYTGYENTGTDLLGEDRLLFGFDFGNLWELDHRVGYQYTTTPEFEGLHAHAATYTIPFYQTRHELRLLFGYVESNVDLPLIAGIPLNSGGESSQVSAEYAIPLCDWNGYEQELTFGFDFKSTNNNLEFGGFSVIDSTAEVFQFAVGHSLKKPTSTGFQSLRNKFVWSPGDLSNHNSDASFQNLRALSEADYVYWNAEFNQAVKLPHGFLFVADVEGQISNANLLPSESLVFGGVGSVRGFDQNIARSDRGAELNLEIYTPAFRPFDCVKLQKELQHQARGFAFYDYAIGSNVDRLPGESDNFRLGGAGLGIDMQITKHASFRLSHAWQVVQEGFADNDTGRWHASAIVKW